MRTGRDRWNRGVRPREEGARGPRPASAGALAVLVLLAIPALVGAQDPAPSGARDTVAVVLDLEEVVRLALDGSRDLRAARLGLVEAEERVSEAWGTIYPDVDLSLDYTRNLRPAVNFIPARFFDQTAGADDLIAVQFGADNSWNSMVSAEQIIFDSRAFIGVGAAGRFRNLQQEMVRGSRQDVVTRVRKAYYDLLLAQEEARLTENSVRRVEASLSETRSLYEAGLAPEYDVLRLEVELANLRPGLRTATNALARARRELALELDLDPATAEALEVEGALAEIELEDRAANSPANRQIVAFTGVEVTAAAEEERLIETALQQRTDLLQAELDESLRQTELRLEQVAYLPRLTAFGDYTVSSQQNGPPEFFGAPRAYSTRAGVQLTVPVFTGLQRDARVDQKRAVLRQSRTQRELARDRAVVEVRNLLDAAREALLRAEAQQLAVELAQRGYEIARAQYREGLGSQLELTDAEVALRESEFNYAQAVYDFLVARADLDRATGLVPGVDAPLGETAGR